jgi:hypothetical protein
MEPFLASAINTPGLYGGTMRNFCAALIATSLMIVPMASADPLTTGPQALAPGKPAGVRAAQSDDPNMPLYFFGAVAVGLGIALAVASNNDNNAVAGSTVTAPTTTTS